jgi:DNA (cytosine-5)-methyltransferase 1
VRIGSLFTGYGGLDCAVEQFFNGETVWTCDNDPGASKIIAHRYPDIPNLGDVTKADWTQVEPVEILTGGWPCQPFSHAGKRLGAADERALWPEVARAVRALRPRYVVLENVAAIASAGELARAAGDLAAFGYVGSWRSLRAADIGAPHGRQRTFILAADAERGGRDGGTRQLGPSWRPQPADSHNPAADADSDGFQSVGRLEPVRRDIDRRCGADIAWGDYEPAIRRWTRILNRPAPSPNVLSEAYLTRRARRLAKRDKRPVGMRGSLSPVRQLSPRFVEWMMGLPEGWVTDVPGLPRNAQLKALGNGVVPQQAYAALQLLTEVQAAA